MTMKSKLYDLLTESYKKALVPNLSESEGPSARKPMVSSTTRLEA